MIIKQTLLATVLASTALVGAARATTWPIYDTPPTNAGPTDASLGLEGVNAAWVRAQGFALQSALGPLATQPAQANIRVVGTTSQGLMIAAQLNGNGPNVQMQNGQTTNNDCVKFDIGGNVVDAGGPCAQPGVNSLSGDVIAQGPGATIATLATTGTPGSYTKVTTDAKGRVIQGSQIAYGDVITALGFVPYSAMNPQGYVAASGVPFLSFNGRAGNVTLSLQDVVTALGFQPYSANNPNGYINASGAPMQSFNGRQGIITLVSQDVVNALGYTPYSQGNPAGFINASQAPVQTVGNKTGNVTLVHTDITDWSASVAAALAGYVQSATLAPLATGLPGAIPFAAVSSSNTLVAAATHGNGPKMQLFDGNSAAANDCVKFDANGNLTDAGAACGTGTGSGGGGGGFTVLTGDVTASGTGSVTASLAQVLGAGSGSFGNATTIPALTVDSKGRVTAVSGVVATFIQNGSIKAINQGLDANVTSVAGAQVGDVYLASDTMKRYRYNGTSWLLQEPAFTGDVTSTAGTLALSLAATGTAGTYTKVITDSKGRVISGSNLAGTDVTAALGYTPYSQANPSNFITSSSLAPYALTANLNPIATQAPLAANIHILGTNGSSQLSSGTLTSGDITGALNFTPYNATNPAGYIGSAALGAYTPTSGLNPIATQVTLGNTHLAGVNNAGQLIASAVNNADVTGAIGYVPYSAANPSGFVGSSALSAYTPTSGLGSLAFSSVTPNVHILSSNASGVVVAGALASGDIVSGLGFVPYNASNPNAYVTAALPTSATIGTDASNNPSSLRVVNEQWVNQNFINEYAANNLNQIGTFTSTTLPTNHASGSLAFATDASWYYDDGTNWNPENINASLINGILQASQLPVGTTTQAGIVKLDPTYFTVNTSGYTTCGACVTVPQADLLGASNASGLIPYFIGAGLTITPTVSGGLISAATSTRQVVCNSVLVGQGGTTSSGDQAFERLSFYCPGGAKNIRLVFPGFWMSGSTPPTETDMTTPLPFNATVEAYTFGDWSPSTTYTVGQQVSHNGYAYQAVASSLNVEPFTVGTSGQWTLFTPNAPYTITCDGKPACSLATTVTTASATVAKGFIQTDTLPVSVPIGGFLNIRVWVPTVTSGVFGMAPETNYGLGNSFMHAATVGDQTAVTGIPTPGFSRMGAYEPLVIGSPFQGTPTVCLIGDDASVGYIGPGFTNFNTTPTSGGTGYKVGELVRVNNVNGSNLTVNTFRQARLIVTAVTGGVVSSFSVFDPGSYSTSNGQTMPSGALTTATINGVGSGLVVTPSGNFSSYDFADPQNGRGFNQRGMDQDGVAYYSLSRSGARTTDWLNRDYSRLALIAQAGCRNAIINLGGNDYRAGTSAATIEANLQFIGQQLIAVGVQNIVLETLLPSTSSTDGYTTTSGQTIPGTDSVRVQVNTDIRGAYGSAYPWSTAGIFDAASIFENSLNSGYWKIGGSVSGGNFNLYTTTGNVPNVDGAVLGSAVIVGTQLAR